MSSTHSVGFFQDCKEFQGELFGICNLFRDLSDKLFTSEIIELNEKQGQQDKDPPSRKQELTELGNSSAPPEEPSPVPSPESENDSKKTSSNPMLEDLGKSRNFRALVTFLNVYFTWIK